jgi:hypothetical protein
MTISRIEPVRIQFEIVSEGQVRGLEGSRSLAAMLPREVAIVYDTKGVQRAY